MPRSSATTGFRCCAIVRGKRCPGFCRVETTRNDIGHAVYRWRVCRLCGRRQLSVERSVQPFEMKATR